MLRILFKPLLILIILFGGYWYFQQNNSSIETPKISVDLNSLQGDVYSQVSVLSSRAQDLGIQARNVLGNSIQVDEDQPSIQEKAINYGQYLYCKQVVDSYEQ